MEEGKIYDTSVIIEMAKRGSAVKVPRISIITVVEYPPAVKYARVVLYPTREDYLLATRWQTKLRKLGSPLPAADLVIAAQAVNNGLVLVTRDAHFKMLKEKVAKDLSLEII
uniref:PIN domain-containing protein n=2 Tax=Thermofilum pendens TaxID=2269 RepID=A0A7J3X552_THEPE